MENEGNGYNFEAVAAQRPTSALVNKYINNRNGREMLIIMRHGSHGTAAAEVTGIPTGDRIEASPGSSKWTTFVDSDELGHITAVQDVHVDLIEGASDYRGVWSGAEDYETGDVVTYPDTARFWRARRDNTNATPPAINTATESTDWVLSSVPIASIGVNRLRSDSSPDGYVLTADGSGGVAFEVSSGGGGGGSNTTPIENLIDNQAAASQFTSVTVTAWADYDVLIFVGHDDSASRDIQCFVSTLALEEDGRANCGISNNDVAVSVTDTNTLSFNRGNAGTGDTVSVWSMDVGVGPAGADGATGDR